MVVLPLTVPEAAEMTDVPADRAEARPPVLIEATPVLLEFQVTEAVRSLVVLSE